VDAGAELTPGDQAGRRRPHVFVPRNIVPLPGLSNDDLLRYNYRMQIADVAKDIKKELAQDDDRDLVFLARLFEDDRIMDTGGGSELQNRLNTILGASSDGSYNGVTHFAGIYAGVTDLGFQKAFKDPFPGKSDNQVGHFTTAVDMGFRPSRTFSVLQQGVQQYVPFDFALPGLPTDESFCVRLIIGHEQAGD